MGICSKICCHNNDTFCITLSQTLKNLSQYYPIIRKPNNALQRIQEKVLYIVYYWCKNFSNDNFPLLLVYSTGCILYSMGCILNTSYPLCPVSRRCLFLSELSIFLHAIKTEGRLKSLFFDNCIMIGCITTLCQHLTNDHASPQRTSRSWWRR